MPVNNKPTMLETAEQSHVVWTVEVKNDVRIKDLLGSDFWVHVAFMLKAGHRIEVTPQNRSYFTELFVLGASKNWAKVVELRTVVIIKDAKNESDGTYIVEFANEDKWRVTKNNEVLAKDFDDKESAKEWLKEHKKEIG